jgi:S-adenosylmethionine hydrolase
MQFESTSDFFYSNYCDDEGNVWSSINAEVLETFTTKELKEKLSDDFVNQKYTHVKFFKSFHDPNSSKQGLLKIHLILHDYS